MKLSKYLSGSLALLLLAACATPTVQTQQWQAQTAGGDFSAEGRLAVQMNEKGSYANFDWMQQNGVQTIDVNTPLGNTVGQLCQDNEGVLAVDSSNRVFTASTAQALSEQLLGFSLPVQYLSVWVKGQRVGGAPYQLLPDGRLQQFEWTVSRQTRPDGTPRILLLESNKLTLRLVFDNMENIVEATDAPNRCAARSRL